MSKKGNVYEYLQVQAIENRLTNSDIAFFRRVCRWYSKTFHTPLHIVMECKIVQWDEILLSYYEESMADLPYNQVFEIACQEYIPELAEEFEKENQEYAEALVEEQQRTIKKKEARDKKKQQLKPAPNSSENKTESVEQKAPAPIRLNFDEEI